jgi:hypothetical protein
MIEFGFTGKQALKSIFYFPSVPSWKKWKKTLGGDLNARLPVKFRAGDNNYSYKSLQFHTFSFHYFLLF